MVNCTDCGRIASVAGKIRASVNRTCAPGRGWRQVGSRRIRTTVGWRKSRAMSPTPIDGG